MTKIECELCDKEFVSEEALSMHNKSKHPERYEEPKKRIGKGQKKKIRNLVILILVLVGIGYFIFFLFTTEKVESYSGGQVHWHSRINVFICGNKFAMPNPFGNQHLGSPLLHTHDDQLIHIEGTVWNPEDITVGKYMEVIGLNFKDGELIDKENGDLCGDESGNVKLVVEGVENSELTNYVIKDDEDYELRFE